ncbi:TlyA family RNA methyltransferase [Serpentinicella sp. ANB-PHB4]|uniref:TlyA family RNA methyltransferase n=1 Tax=Serpentinicella sp. ANB-PHB4 TaxID=3074076 RepID=UPI0028643626|nr:TlyA family RNA methyltransferase [Serpentinicella sp. ANB-PHB4]MDR5658183.1 TlyA family RNA methyltransferase [Serpentinicella sp. ANB-PHB4]
MNKKRLDVLLVEKALFETREKAKRAIMAGLVFVEQQKIDKAGTLVNVESDILIKGALYPYVSRGGLKLEKALKTFDLSVDNKICMDIGASTGGFTHCMLLNGAKKIYAVDVGYGQLDWKLRQDEKVVVMERTNIRNVTKNDISDSIEFASIDVSFISLKLVLPVLKDLLKENSEVVALIKPQFEAGRDKVGKKGVVREKSTHIEVIREITSYAINLDFSILNITFSPVKGPEGNIEYLLHLLNNKDMGQFDLKNIEDIVNDSHTFLIK